MPISSQCISSEEQTRQSFTGCARRPACFLASAWIAVCFQTLWNSVCVPSKPPSFKYRLACLDGVYKSTLVGAGGIHIKVNMPCLVCSKNSQITEVWAISTRLGLGFVRDAWSLLERYCLLVAVRRTIQHDSLFPWSLRLHSEVQRV